MKKSELRLMIREIVREEVAMSIKEVITEMTQPIQSESKPRKKNHQQKPKRKVVEKQDFSTNPIINDVLNETAQSEEWKTMGGGKYDSIIMGEVLGKSYGDMMSGNPNTPVTVDGQQPDFLKKDYSKLMKTIDKKQGK